MPVNNPIDISLINVNMILYNVPFIKDSWISKISLVSIGLKSTEKNCTIPFNPVFFFHIVNCKIF